MDTLALDSERWDIRVGDDGVIMTCGDAPPAPDRGVALRLATLAAVRVQTWRGEVYYDSTIGLPFDSMLGGPPNLSLLASQYAAEARRVEDVQTAIPDFTFAANGSRRLSGRLYVSNFSGEASQVLL